MKMMIMSVLAIVAGAIGISCMSVDGDQGAAPKSSPAVKVPAGASELVVGGGCFWCLEVLFEDVKGVYLVESGYAGGDRPNPTYEQVCTGASGHAEVIKIFFDPKVVSSADLQRLFYGIHDPTTLNRQGPDSGTQYRSVVFYIGETEKNLAEKIRKEISDAKIFSKPIVTTIEPMKNYTRAEEYHQDYFAKYEKASAAEKMKMNSGYCAAIIEPKVSKFRQKYKDLLKKP